MQASRFVRELFKNPRAISAIVPPAPAERPGGRLPHGGCLLHGATLERLCDCVLACRVVLRGHVPLYAIVAVHVVAVHVVATSWLWLCRVRRGCGCVALGVTPAVPCRGCGCGVRRLFVAVVWLRHADEC